ncbi:hypothetical protein ACIP1U_14105 [Cupriavidus sp. NPDC089707]|uniref:hypothetical protein n=1 Tax=Cupriavidus sp. NPDC089707 TaxID=3363963 RepID=UPI00380E1C52
MDHVPTLKGRRILVIEADYGVSQAIMFLLEGECAAVIGLVGWADDALALIGSQGTTLDAALPDIDLHGERSYVIAPAYRNVPRCQKPFKVEELVKALSTTRA